MKYQKITFTTFLLFALAGLAIAQEKSRALLSVGQNAIVITVQLAPKDTPATSPQVTLFRIGKESERLIDVPVQYESAGSFGSFRMNAPLEQDLANVSFEVVVLIDAADGGKRRVRMTALPQLSGALRRPQTECASRDNIYLILRSALMGHDWTETYAWLDHYIRSGKRIARLKIAQKGLEDNVFNVSIHGRVNAAGSILGVCFNLDELLPTEKFTATLTDFSEEALPISLSRLVAASEFDGAFKTVFAADRDRVAPEKRKLERTIDIAGFLTSSVSDEEVPDTTPPTLERKRKTVGIIDLDFKAPDILRQEYKFDSWIHQLSPFFIKASVSTEKITKDTLSQNRVLFGFEGESRYIAKDGAWGGTINRFIWGVTHASDRDFKQKEIYASARYAPLINSLYRPYDLNYTVVKDQVKYKGFGFVVVPSVGFDIGRTYNRNNPASAVEETDPVKRLNFGLKLGLDITRKFSVNVEDTFYVRFETPEHRKRNMFSVKSDFRLFHTSRDHSAHSLFVVFEKGWAPPFTGQQVNSVRIGYRVVGDFFCSVHCR